MNIHNFLFHRVNPKRDSLWDPMDIKLFERCVRYISRKHQVVLLEDFFLSSVDIELQKKSLATISFDDGYKDNTEYAVPILDKYNCKASFYVVTDCIEHNRLTWTHILEYAFQHTRQQKVCMGFSFLPENLRVQKLADKHERIKYINRLKPFLRVTTHKNRIKTIAQVQKDFFDVDYPELMMSWDDLRELKTAGHYIGSHSLSHPVLSTIDDPQIIKDELYFSAEAIEKEIGYFPLSIAYPLGKYNNMVVKLAQQCGYKMGLAVGQEIYYSQKHNIFEIPRTELYNEAWWKTSMRMSGRLDRFKRLLGK